MSKTILRSVVIALIVSMLLMLSACAGSPTTNNTSSSSNTTQGAQKKTLTLRIGSGHSTSNPWVAALEEYFVKNVSERVEKETNYSINWVKSYGGSVITLGNELEGVESGLVDIGCIIMVFESSRMPLQTMTYSMPFSCNDPLIVAKVSAQMMKEFPEMTTDYETKYNQKFIGQGLSDQYGLFGKKEISSLADIKGMKIGAAGINLAWIEGSGAVGVQTSLNDTFQNLQTSVCDATIQPTHSCINLKVYEVAPYYLDANFNVIPFFNVITVNLDVWKSLPSEVQKILSEVGEGYLDYESKYINDVHEKDLQFMKDNGVKIKQLNREAQAEWANSLADIVNGLVKRLNDAGYDGSKIVGRYYELLEENGIEKVRDWVIK